MTASGIFSLGDVAITAEDTYYGPSEEGLTDLDGMTQADAQLDFAYGSGGTSGKIFVQTSLDQGTTWIDLWCLTVTTAAKTRAVSLQPNGTIVTPTDGALADDTISTGRVLGDRLRVKAVMTGIYAGSTVLSGRVAVR